MKPILPMHNWRSKFSEPEELRAFLASYWRVALVCVLLILVIVLACGAWQLWGVMHLDVFLQAEGRVVSQNQPLTTAQVDAVLTGFADRKARFDALKAAHATSTDPGR